MTFEAAETGAATSKPVRLYLFKRGLLKWGYCTADRNITYEGVLYASAAISDDGIRHSGESTADILKITAPTSLGVLSQFRPIPPSMEVAVTVSDYQFTEIMARVRWTGSVTGVDWPEFDKAEISCESISASMEKTGLRMGYGRGCPYTLYDQRCLASMAAVRLDTTLTAVGTLTITSPAFSAFADGYFAGGFIQWLMDGETSQRGIEAHTGTLLTLLDITAGLTVGTVVTAYPGCDRTISVCDSRFSNHLNFGGIPNLPGKSPFSGDPIY